jgi:negative regulator of sigma E activity
MVNKSQSLSDLLDDQCSADELEQLLVDSETNDQWFRYQAVSAILKNEYSANASTDFCQSISQKIAGEPAIISAPAMKSKHNNAEIHQFPTEIKRFGGGFAIAATVAFATFFSVQTMQVAELDVDLDDGSVASVTTSSNNEVSAASTLSSNNATDYNEQAEAEIFKNLYFQDSRRKKKGGIAQVSGEYVKTIRFSAEQWQVILQRSLDEKAKQDAAKEVEDSSGN